jgi:CIC family chloride channel protein
MVRAPPTIPAETPLRDFRAAYPLGSAHVVVAVDEAGHYRGLVLVPEAHAVPLEENEDGGPVSAVARLAETTLHPDVDVRSALAIFDAAEADTLAVTERDTGHVVGLLGETFAARRYAQETDRAAKGVLGGG